MDETEVAETVKNPEPTPRSTVVAVRDMSVDLAGVFPLRVGDWRRLEALGVSSKQIERVLVDDKFNLDITVLSVFLAYVLGKVNPQITVEYLDEMTQEQLYALYIGVLNVRASPLRVPT